MGLGGRNQIEVCEVAEISRLGAPRRHRPLSRIAWRDHDAGQLGARRRHPRRTQAADAFQLGRVPARLQGLGLGRRHRHRGQSEGVRRIRARIASSPARPSCWIPAAARSTIPSRSAARFRSLGALTTVGATVRTQTPHGERASVAPEAYCESMCVFLLLSGKTRYVPPAAHVRVHQIWMGDRADDAKAASYTAQDLMIVERDIGRLAKYTFDMGGAGDLLSLALSVPPWEDLHEIVARRIAADQSRHDRCGRRRAPAGQCVGADGRSEAFKAAGSLRQFRRRGRRATAAGASRPRPPKPRFRPAAAATAPAQPQK